MYRDDFGHLQPPLLLCLPLLSLNPFLFPLLLLHFVFDFGGSLSLFGVTCMSMDGAHLLEFETLTSGYTNEENDSLLLATIN